MTYEIKIEWATDFVLYDALKHEMQRKWEQTISAANFGLGKGFWSSEIDTLADVLLEVIKAQAEYLRR